MATNRLIVTTDSPGFDPTGLKAPIDAPTAFRKAGDVLHRGAQGGAAQNLSVAFNPVAARARVNTTTGSETADDTLTIGNVAITLKASGSSAASNQADIAAGTAGTSASAASPATTATGLAVYVNVNGDGAQIIYIDDAGTHTGAQIASKIQTAIRALTPRDSRNAVALSSATCAYTTVYTITSGAKGSNSSVVVTPVPGNAGATNLKLGVGAGGTEAAGTASTLNNIAGLINGTTASSPNSWNGICSAFVCGQNLFLTATIPGTIGNGIAATVSSTGSVMTIAQAFGVNRAGTEGTANVFQVGAVNAFRAGA